MNCRLLHVVLCLQLFGDGIVQESKKQCVALQQELDTSETVQLDFVKLSQTLQIEIEKIRQAEQVIP